jgi:FkbM family methyltransferase
MIRKTASHDMPSVRATSRTKAFIEKFLIGIAVVVSIGAVTNVVRNYYRGQSNLARYLAEDGQTELGPIVEKYGPARYSRNFEEWLVRDYFQDRRDGVFLDVGANHYRDESNTYFLEKELGWSGIAIDALEEFAADYRRYRPRTTFIALFVSDVDDSSVPFFVPDANKLVASANREFTASEGGAAGHERSVPTTTLNAVLDQGRITRLDFMSMDIELSEPKALAGFDIEKFRPALVCIEAHVQVRQQILDYFMRHGYTIVGKYLRIDTKNLYFRPSA